MGKNRLLAQIGKLRNLDKEINTALLKIAKDKRKVYFIGGHGEMTDPDSIPSEIKRKLRTWEARVLDGEITPQESQDLRFMYQSFVVG